MALSTPPTTTPAPPAWEIGLLLRAERERQGLSRTDVTVATRLPEDKIRFCETGPWPSWKALQPYIDFLSLDAKPDWVRKLERALDRATNSRLDELSPAGRLMAKAVMLKACRDSSVGRAVVRPTAWAQLNLGLRSSRRAVA